MARRRIDVRREGAGADEMGMKQTAKHLSFNPSLGLAVKGMWLATLTKAVLEAMQQDDSEPASESQAA